MKELVPCPNACGSRFLCRVCKGDVKGKIPAAMMVEYELLNIDGFGISSRTPNDWCTAVDALRKRHGYE